MNTTCLSLSTTMPYGIANQALSSVDFQNINFSNIKEKFIHAQMIKNIGSNWSILPIEETYKNKIFILGWRLQYSPRQTKSTYGCAATIFITAPIVEADILTSADYVIFRTRQGLYYKVSNINKDFKENGWFQWASALLHKKLVSYALPENIYKKHISDLHKNSIDYITPVVYNIHIHNDDDPDDPDDDNNFIIDD